MGFNTKMNLVNAKFYQQDGGTLTLSGDTCIADVGRLAYLTDQSAVFNATPRSIPDASWITGKTSAALSNYYTKTQINSYTGQTNTRITTIENKYITGATNGIGLSGKNVCLGGALVANTIIGTGSNLFGVNAGNINLTGATLSASGVIKLISTPAAGLTSDSILVWNSTDKCVKAISGGAVLTSAITGATNGLTKTAQIVRLGGALTQATTITVATGTSLLVTDNRTTPIGIQYGGDYSATYTARSIPDAGYVTGRTSQAILTANNGLTKVGSNVVLGGTLTGATSVCLGSNSIDFDGINGSVYIGGSTGANTFGVYSDYINLAGSVEATLGVNTGSAGGVLCISTTKNSFTDHNTTKKGIEYNSDYSSTFVARSLVDAAYVTGKTSQAILTANNGLTKVGTEVVLGGALTGNTTISSGTHDNCLIITAPLKADDVHYFTFHDNPVQTGFTIGRLYYQDNSLNLDREFSGVTLQIGEENVIKAYNNTGSQLPNGTAVYITGSAGNIPTIGKPIASNEAQAINTIGLTTHNIVNGGDGYVTTFGVIHDIDTSLWSAGTPLYLSATVAGGITSTKPDFPNEVVLLGYVTFQDTGGTITVNISEQTEYVNIGTFTGYTAQTQTLIDEKVSILTFTGYTASTDIRLDNLETVSAVAITGVTNGLTKVGTDCAKLGGGLTENTTICGISNTLTLGKLCAATIDVAGASGAITLLTENSGSIYLQSTTGSTFQSSFANSVGMFIDYNAATGSGFKAYDNRVGANQVGIVYAADYSTTYCARSLVDKAYVDSIATGLNVHAAVEISTTAPITLSGSQSIDGYSTQNGWRVLVKDQVDDTLNGIYISTGTTWYRADDYNFSPLGEISNGDLIPVLSGTSNSNTQWILTTPNPIVSGDSLVYSQFSKTITISEGNGIDIANVGGSQQISIELAPNNAGLCFLGTGLRIDNAMFSTGLTYYTVGGQARARVNGVYCAPVGTCIPVAINTSGCQLYVDSSCVVSAAGAITSANNGLTKAGTNVRLGGALTGNTTITGGGTNTLGFTGLNAFNLGFNSSTITDNSGGEGLTYAADYSSSFIDNSLVSKYFVNNAITGTTLTYNNGLTKLGKVVSWGGTLTGNTQVARGAAILCFSCAATTSCIDLYTTCSRFHSEDTYAQLQSCTNGTCDGTIRVNNTGAILLTTNNATLPICITSPNAMKYAGDYSGTYTARSIPDAAWVTGKTSTAGIQTANNGLTKQGTNVRLGGALTGNTSITGAFTLNINGSALLSTQCGYQIANQTILRTTNSNTSLYAGLSSGSAGAAADNVGIGNSALTGVTTGTGNVAIGSYTLINHKTGNYNVGIGYVALGLNTSGTNNTSIGCYSMYYNIGGSCNIAIGPQSLFCNTSGSNNIALGEAASNRKTTGIRNITLGSCAALCNTIGSSSIAIGFSAGALNITGSSNVFIGQNAGYSETTSNKLYIANTNACNLIYGDFVNNFVTLPTVKICNTPISGTTSDSILVWNSSDKCVKIVNGGAVLSSAITGATNGLTKVGADVKLGGTLTEGTTISMGTANNSLEITTTGSSMFGFYNNGLYAYYEQGTGLGEFTYRYNQQHDYIANGDYYVDQERIATATCAYDILRVSNGANELGITLNTNSTSIIVTDGINSRGIRYAGNYESNFVPTSLVTAQYVTDRTSQAITGATNGLTKVGTQVKLGGALTGNTTITGAYTFGVNVTTINLTSTTVGITGTTVNIGGAVKLTTAPSTGVGTDAVLVRATDGTVKTVSGAILGDKNNIYAKTTITSNTILSTGSTYVILVSHSGIAVTVTLPSTPKDGQAFKFKDITGNALTYPITVDGNGNLLDGAASGMINTDYGALEIVYDTASDQWYSLAFIN